MRRLALLLAAASAGCASLQPDYHAPGYHGAACVNLLDLADEQPLSPGQPVNLVPLGKAEDVSHHLAIVGEEPLHKHESHSMTVYGLRGEGILRIVHPEGNRTIQMGPGSIVLVPRGTTHSFHATGGAPFVALAVFSPPYDGKDAVRVEP
ncbi:MAG TPA: cupin domain-containing protein [Planctomycetota bacterium]|nr:cupin domain-containing protein [Planctomycetota bacterium]